MSDWILCSDRMPEEREWIGTERFGTTISDEVYVTFETPAGERFTDHLSFQNGKLSPFFQKGIDAFHKGSIPIAWMPLPEPYKGRKRERMTDDIELVIKIPEEGFGIEIDDKFQDFFKRLKVEIKEHLITNTSLLCGAYELETVDMLLKAFNNSTPLPKGHGDLKDIEECNRKLFYQQCGGANSLITVKTAFDMLLSLPTIIEADKGSEDKE